MPDRSQGHVQSIQERFRVLQKVPETKVFLSALEAIVQFIDANGLEKGDRLPTVRELSSSLGVSVPTLRRSLGLLEDSGVVKVRRGQDGGVFVDCDVVPVSVLERRILTEAESASKIVIARHLFEPIAMHLAAERGTTDDFDDIDRTITLMDQPGLSNERIVAVDGAYHRRVAYATHDGFVIQTMLNLYRELLPLKAAHPEDLGTAEHMVSVHRAQLKAIIEKDHEQIDILSRDSFIDLERFMGFSFPFQTVWQRRE